MKQGQLSGRCSVVKQSSAASGNEKVYNVRVSSWMSPTVKTNSTPRFLKIQSSSFHSLDPLQIQSPPYNDAVSVDCPHTQLETSIID